MTAQTTATIRVNRTAQAVHISRRVTEDSIGMPLCGAPGNTPAAYRAFRPVVTTDPVTCKRCLKAAA